MFDRILIVDDDDALRESLEMLLASEGYSVVTAHSGEQALEYTLDVRIHIVLLDMHMHVLTGLETLRVLKSQDAVRPCILITSEANDQLREDAQEADAFTVLNKPVKRAGAGTR